MMILSLVKFLNPTTKGNKTMTTKTGVAHLVCFHHNLHNVGGFFDDGKIADSLSVVTATDGIMRIQVTTQLVRNNTGFIGKPRLSSMMLKGITDKLLVPSIIIPNDNKEILLKMDFGNVSFTQLFKKDNYHSVDRPLLFGHQFLESMKHRVMQTYYATNTMIAHGTSPMSPILTPDFVKELLEKEKISIKQGVHKETTYTLVKTTTNDNIKKVINCGLIVRRANVYYNKEKKEDVSYYVITATGRVMVFEGDNTDFENPVKTGYVLLTNPTKAKKFSLV